MKKDPEPDYGETLQVFDQEFIYLGRDSTQVFLQHPETEKTHEYGFWEFVEGRMAAAGET